MQKASSHPVNLRFSICDLRFKDRGAEALWLDGKSHECDELLKPTYAWTGYGPNRKSAIVNRKFTGLLHIVGIWLQVLFHSPSRGSFHLSLAVLVHYRLPRSI